MTEDKAFTIDFNIIFIMHSNDVAHHKFILKTWLKLTALEKSQCKVTKKKILCFLKISSESYLYISKKFISSLTRESIDVSMDVGRAKTEESRVT